MSGWTLAIDFGTSGTLAAASIGGATPDVIELDGSRAMPSLVFIDDSGEVIVGKAADALAAGAPDRAIRAPKRRLADPAPVVVAGRAFAATALVASVLRHVVAQSTAYQGSAPNEIRLTHPAMWGRPQIARLAEAAALAGISAPKFVPEPVGAAIAYAIGGGIPDGGYVAVHDLGGGTFDTAILRAEPSVVPGQPGAFSIVGRPAGDPNLGGELFDELIAQHLIEGLDANIADELAVSDDPVWKRAAANLLTEARRAKEALSLHPYADVLLTLPHGLVQRRITRAEVDTIVDPYLHESMDRLLSLVSDAGLRPEQLSAVFLLGGASRMPRVMELVQKTMGGVPVVRKGDPKSAVAVGAAHPSADRSFSSFEARPGSTEFRSGGTDPGLVASSGSGGPSQGAVGFAATTPLPGGASGASAAPVSASPAPGAGDPTSIGPRPELRPPQAAAVAGSHVPVAPQPAQPAQQQYAAPAQPYSAQQPPVAQPYPAQPYPAQTYPAQTYPAQQPFTSSTGPSGFQSQEAPPSANPAGPYPQGPPTVFPGGSYGQPPAPGWGNGPGSVGPVPAPVRKKSSKGPLIGVGVLVGLLLLGGGVFAATQGGKDTVTPPTLTTAAAEPPPESDPVTTDAVVTDPPETAAVETDPPETAATETDPPETAATETDPPDTGSSSISPIALSIQQEVERAAKENNSPARLNDASSECVASSVSGLDGDVLGGLLDGSSEMNADATRAIVEGLVDCGSFGTFFSAYVSMGLQQTSIDCLDGWAVENRTELADAIVASQAGDDSGSKTLGVGLISCVSADELTKIGNA